MTDDERPDTEARTRQMVAEVTELRGVIAALTARLDVLETDLAPAASLPVATTSTVDTTDTTDAIAALATSTNRRKLLTTGVAAAAGAALAGTAASIATASPAAAAPGTFDGNPAVTGTASPNSGVGVLGTTESGIAVDGRAGATGNSVGVRGWTTSSAGTGVVGQSTSQLGGTGVEGRGVFLGVRGVSDTELGTGVLGFSEGPSGFGVRGVAPEDDGIGVNGHADGVGGRGAVGDGRRFGVVALSQTSQLGLSSTTTLPFPPLDANLFRGRGEIAFDSNADLWLCVADGNPGTWRRVSGPGTAGAFVPLPAPVRAYDSRPPFPPATGPKTKLTPNTARTVDCTLNGTTVPTTATGVLVSLVATGSNAAGHVAIYRDTIPYPNTSNANFAAGQTVAVTTFSAVTAGKVAVLSNQAIDVVIDVLGYYQ